MCTHVSILWIKSCQIFRKLMCDVTYHKSFGLGGARVRFKFFFLLSPPLMTAITEFFVMVSISCDLSFVHLRYFYGHKAEFLFQIWTEVCIPLIKSQHCGSNSTFPSTHLSGYLHLFSCAWHSSPYQGF